MDVVIELEQDSLIGVEQAFAISSTHHVILSWWNQDKRIIDHDLINIPFEEHRLDKGQMDDRSFFLRSVELKLNIDLIWNWNYLNAVYTLYSSIQMMNQRTAYDPLAIVNRKQLLFILL